MLTMLLSTIGSLLGITGWFVKKSIILLLIGFALTLVETVTEWKNYNTGAKNMFVILFIIGAVIGIYTKTPFWVGGLLSLMIYDLILLIFSIIGLFAVNRR